MTNPYPPQMPQFPQQGYPQPGWQAVDPNAINATQNYQPTTFNPMAQGSFQPAMPQQFQAPAQQFGQYQPGYPQAPAQQFGQYQPGYPQAPAAPRPAPVQGTLGDFFAQPVAGEGKSWSWNNAPLGSAVIGMVARELTDADTQQQTNAKTGELQWYRNGTAKSVLKIPMIVQPSPEFPEGKAVWWVNRRMHSELVAAMKAAGFDGQLPEVGAVITRRLVDRRALFPNSGAANIEEITYQRPQGAVGNAPVSAPAPQVQPQTVMSQVPAPQPQYAGPVGATATSVASSPAFPVQQPVTQVEQPGLPGMPMAAPAAPAPAQAQAPLPVADPAAGLPQLTPAMQQLMQTLDNARAQ